VEERTGTGSEERRVAPVVELVGTGASWRSSRMERWHRRRTGTAALTHGDGGELEQRWWHAVSDRERRRGAQTWRRDGRRLQVQRSAAFKPVLSASDSGDGAGRRFMAQARA
jgi:hypothetical protein